MSIFSANTLASNSISSRRKFHLTGLFLILFFLNVTHVVSQKQYLEITNSKNKRVKKIREKKKITVYTDDLEVKGFLKILDSETILIDNQQIKVSDIKMIRNKTILVKLFSFVVLPLVTLTSAFVFAITGNSNESTSALIMGSSAIILSTQLKKKYKTERYKFQIVYD